MNSKELAFYIRKKSLEMVNKSGASHIGSILSCADILGVLYTDILNYDASNPKNKMRDRFILSKGHAVVALYATLAKLGFINENLLRNYYENGSELIGHANNKINGIEVSTGALGHGLPIAIGMAMALKSKESKIRIIVLMGDGECNEGTVWESALIANQFKLSNLDIIIDYNKMQAMGKIDNIITLSSLKNKWESFGFDVIEIDGHNHDEIREALISNEASRTNARVIIANTKKGAGISFMENDILWHYRSPQGKEYDDALLELDKKYER